MKFFKMLEQLSASVAFAEEGEWASALEMLQHQSANKKIVIAYEGDVVNKELVDYSFNISQRVKYDMLFAYIVNQKKLARMGKNKMRAFTDKIKEDVQNSLTPVFSDAKKAGVHASHIIVFDNFQDAVLKLCRDVKKIEFLVLGCKETCVSHLKVQVPYFYFK
ncbi:MAG: hypothetical protein AB7E47_05070 [Desulfovibrionaceae bacterium]